MSRSPEGVMIHANTYYVSVLVRSNVFQPQGLWMLHLSSIQPYSRLRSIACSIQYGHPSQSVQLMSKASRCLGGQGGQSTFPQKLNGCIYVYIGQRYGCLHLNTHVTSIQVDFDFVSLGFRAADHHCQSATWSGPLVRTDPMQGHSCSMTRAYVQGFIMRSMIQH